MGRSVRSARRSLGFLSSNPAETNQMARSSERRSGSDLNMKNLV